MGKILGIIGGGQLGMMLTESAKKMPEHISKIIVLDPTENCPAAQVGAEQIVCVDGYVDTRIHLDGFSLEELKAIEDLI